MKYSLSILYVILMFASCGPNNESVCPDATCDDYASQQDAQDAFDDDPECLGELDNDNDRIACEHLGNGGGTSCPTTNNCGCSNKKKAECGGDCCQWIVGTGCRCK